jgi:hypothetical protein
MWGEQRCNRALQLSCDSTARTRCEILSDYERAGWPPTSTFRIPRKDRNTYERRNRGPDLVDMRGNKGAAADRQPRNSNGAPSCLCGCDAWPRRKQSDAIDLLSTMRTRRRFQDRQGQRWPDMHTHTLSGVAWRLDSTLRRNEHLSQLLAVRWQRRRGGAMRRQAGVFLRTLELGSLLPALHVGPSPVVNLAKSAPLSCHQQGCSSKLELFLCVCMFEQRGGCIC